MKCVVPGINLKVFGKAIHSLAKIGDEVYFEPLDQGLSLRTVNSSRSAYACFLFFPSYFQHYDDGRKQTSIDESSEDEDEGFRCKVTMKSIMAVFRSLSSIEKTVEKCKISHNAKEARLVFELHCRHGIVKKHNLAYTECESLQAVFSKDLCPNKLTAPSKLLCEVVVNFQTTQEEITLAVQPETLSLKNYVEDEPDPNKVVHTELSLAPEEFDLYQVGEDANITFCLKELRAILAFGETTGLPVNINFETAGRPVTFCIDSDQTFEANFVLATLADAEQTSSQMPASQRVQQAANASQSHRKNTASATAVAAAAKQGGSRLASGKTYLRNSHTSEAKSVPGRSAQQDSARNGCLPSQEGMREGNNMADVSAEELAAAMEVEQEWEEGGRDQPPQNHETENDRPSGIQTGEKDRSSKNLGNKRSRPLHGHETERDHLSRNKDRERARASHSKAPHLDKGKQRVKERLGGHRQQLQDEEGEGDGPCSSPVIPLQCAPADTTRQGHCLQPLSGDDDDNDDLNDTIPGTPPSTPPAKKFRSLFFGSSQKNAKPPPNTTVLAADTDEED